MSIRCWKHASNGDISDSLIILIICWSFEMSGIKKGLDFAISSAWYWAWFDDSSSSSGLNFKVTLIAKLSSEKYDA